MINGQPIRFIEFGPFRLDPRERMLLRDGEPVALTPKVFDILLVLVENRGHTLSRDELIETIWPDSYVEVGNLNRNISTLRRVLGEDSHQPKFIKTFPKHGYRFEADVKEIVAETGSFSERSPRSSGLNTAERANFTVFGRPVMMIAGLVILAGLLAVAWPYARNVVMFDAGTGASDLTGRKPRQEAIDLYTEARRLWRDRSGESLHTATLMLEQAIGIEPNFALAHAALADAYAFDTQNRTKAEQTARRAIELDPTLGEPHATLGFLRMFWEWKPLEAEQHFKTAITLSPNYATARQWYSINLSAIGEGNGALAEMKRALELEPDSAAINSDACRLYYHLRRFRDAESHCERALAIDRSLISSNQVLYDIYMASKKYDQAVDQFFRIEELVNHYSTDPDALNSLRSAYRNGYIRAFWRKRAEMLQRRPTSNYAAAKYYARLGETDKTFEHLRRAYEARELDFLYFLSEPLFVDCCFGDPRYDYFPPFLPIR